MKKVLVKVGEILSLLGDDVKACYGDYQGAFIDNIVDAERVNATSLDWIGLKCCDKQSLAENSRARILLVDPSVDYSSVLRSQKKVVIVVENPKVSVARIGNVFFISRPLPGIHPTAVIDEDAIIGEGVHIGPYCFIGKAHIGNNCVLEGNVRINDDVIMGDNCSVKYGAVLGGEGFGFITDASGNKHRFPQIGGLIIGDNVEIGANTCIDRGALSNTVIGDYTKINNLCHIAHNNRIGQNVTITGCVNISGSNTIKDGVWIAPNASIRGFLSIGENSIIGMGAVVTKDIPDNETWVGNPARLLIKNQ